MSEPILLFQANKGLPVMLRFIIPLISKMTLRIQSAPYSPFIFVVKSGAGERIRWRYGK